MGYINLYEISKEQLDYLEIDRTSNVDNNFAYNLFVRAGNWLLIFGNFVPISLMVTLEFVKLFQALMIIYDPKMIYHFLDDNK